MPPTQDDQINQQSTNSSGREPVAYTPRADAEVLADLMQGIVSQETAESLRLANPDTSPAAARLKTDIQAIVTRLIERNNLDPKIYTPEVVISTQTHANAMISPNGEKSILMVTAGLLLSVRTEDELAGVIAHELAHRFLRQKANGAQQGEASKVEESLADITSLKFLEEAGYNPHAPIDLAHRMGEGFRIINIDDVKQADSFDKKLDLIKELADPHPSWPMRIREMEDAMVAYGRYRGVNPSVDRRQEPISNTLQENAREIWGVYKSPIAEGLKRSGYYDSSTAEQLRILTDLVRQNFPPFNQTSADRLEEISRRIRRQRVDFDNVEERLAFTELADSIMGPLEYGNKRLVFPSTRWYGNSIQDTLYPALEEVWATEHGISVEDARARGERISVGRVADLEEAVTGFMNARTAEEAVLHAKSIVEISAKIDFDYSRRGNFEGFYPPTEAMVKSAISSNGQWSAPYRQHVEWFQQTQSEELRQVLQAMSLDADPWAADIIGKKSRSHWERETGLHDIPTIPSDRGYKTTLGGYKDSNYVYLDVADRDAAGNVLKVLEPIASFQPRKLGADASKADITRSNAADIPNREQYDRRMIAEADWSMLATDFKKFVSVYGPAVAPHASLAHGTYPFAEKFFYELDQILPNASDEYKKNVSDYMWVAFRDNEDGAHGFSEKIIASFNSSEDWPYEGIEWPKRYAIDHPAIQFISREPGKSIVSDLSKIHFFQQTEGLLKPGMARFGEQFNLPVHNILNYPHAETVQMLVDKVATGEYIGTAIAIEAERLAHHLGTQIPIEDAFVLDKLARVGSRAPAFGENSLEQDFKTLRRANYEYHLGNTNDVAKLVQDYRFASASGLFLESPDMRSAAQEKIGPALDALPLGERVNAMRDLLRSENVPVPYNNAIDYKYQDPSYEGYRLRLPYTGHIDDPVFRNSIIDGYSSALALELGQDDGSTAYQERARAVVADVNKYSSGITKFGILSQLAEKVNAQRELAYHIRDIYREQAVGQALAQHMSSIVGELHINEASRDPLLASLIVDYLSTPLTNTSHQELLDYTATKYDYSVKKSPSTVYQLQNYHKNFWSSSLEVRAAYLEKLVFPLESTVDQQKAIIRNLVNDTFPDASGEQGRNNRYAREIVDAYLNTADVPERRLLTTAMLAAQMQESSAVKPSIGEKLHTVLSHLGPAGGKLMQAIHSNPQTPQEIKDALIKSKTMYDPPLRWDVVEAVEKAGMLTQGSLNHVAHIGKIAGAGSFGITVFNTTQDGQQVADTFLRQHAADRAEREFEMMHRAATDISTRLPELKSITTMVAEARRSAVVETDMGMARSQNAAAEASYHGIQTTVTHDGQAYLFTHKVAPLIESGETYKRVGIAQGAHFNDLPESTPQEIAYKTAAAKAIFATQLSLRLSGALTDHDRHGGNVKIEGDTITHFDFGAMAVEPLTAEDKAVTGKIIGQALRDVAIGRDFNDSLLKYMDEVKVSDSTRNYIEGMRKDILALGDYAHLISTPDVKAIAANVLSAPTVDPEINSAFQKTLGIAAPIARAMIKQHGNKAGIIVTSPVLSSPSNQAEIIPTIADGLSAELTLSVEPSPTLKPTSFAQLNPSENLALPDAVNPKPLNVAIPDLLRESPQSSSRKASLLGSTAMTAPIIVSETGVEGASALRPIVIADSFPSFSDAPKPGSSAPRTGGLVHMSAGSGAGVALGGLFTALRYAEGGSMDTAHQVDEATRMAERRELLGGTVETAAGKGSEQLRAETLASRADIAGMAPDGGFLATVAASKVAPKVAPGLMSGLQGAVTNGARVLGPVSLLAAAGVTYAEMQAAKAAQDGRREAGALYGLLGGIAGGAGTGALAGAWGGPWGALIGGTGGAIAAGFLATEYGRRSQMGDQMQRDLDHQAQYAIDASVERLREIRNSMMRGESLSDADKRDVRAIYVAMAEQHARLEVLYVPETDIDGQLRRDFQLNQTAKAMAFLEEPSANMLNLPRTSIQSAQVASSRLPALVEQINARDSELNWKQWLDQDRFGKKDGIVTVAEVVKAANEYGIDLYTLDRNGNGLALEELLSTLHAAGVDSNGVRAGRTFTPNTAPLIADDIHPSFAGRAGAVHLLETLDKLQIPGLNGQQLRGIMEQYGISVAMLDLKVEGKINEGDIARAFMTNGVPKETLNGLADHIIKLVPRYREGAEVWPTHDARLDKLRNELKEYDINSGTNNEADVSRWNQARNTALDYLVNGGTSDDARFKLTRFSVNIISTLDMEKIGMLRFMDTNRDGKIDADKEALPWLAKHKIQFSDTNGNNVIDVNEFAAGLPANVRAMIDIEKARPAEVKIPDVTPTATPAVAEAQPAPAPEEKISEIVVTASRKPQGRER